MKTCRSISFSVFLLLAQGIVGQSYFKLLTYPPSSFYQRIALFPDGSVLVADHINIDLSSEFYLAKFDVCGEVIWAKYNKDVIGRLLFDAIEINEDGEIFIMGTELNGSTETLFLMKLNADGEVLRYRIFPGNWTEEFAYTMSLLNGRLMVSGALFYPGNTKKGHIAIFDENLEPLWSRQYEPFDAYGESLLTSDGGALVSLGKTLAKTDAQGNVQWGRKITSNLSNPTISRPIEIPEGYVFNIYESDFSAIFRIGKNGDLDWQSGMFPSSYHHFDPFRTLPNGDILMFYHCPDGTDYNPCQLRITADGQVQQQKQLQAAYPLDAGFISQRVGSDGLVHLVGNASTNAFSPDKDSDFLAQFPIDGPTGECFDWEPFTETMTNDIPIYLSPTSIVESNAPLMVEEQPIPVLKDLTVGIIEICPLPPTTEIVRTDSVLHCDRAWMVKLPDNELVWEDGTPNASPRLLTLPGLYRAWKSICRDSTIFEYFLEKTACECKVFLPNAISPNNDGSNDELRPFSNCSFTELQMEVYDRWGNQVYSSQDPLAFWDGSHKGKAVSLGVYVVSINYRLMDALGMEQAGALTQDVTLLR